MCQDKMMSSQYGENDFLVANMKLLIAQMNDTSVNEMDGGRLLFSELFSDAMAHLNRTSGFGSEMGCNGTTLQTRDCDDTRGYMVLMGYCFFPMLLLCLFGNFMNIAIYRLHQMRRFLAIRMLSLRVLCNAMYVVFLVPQASRLIQLWQRSSTAETVFWYSFPYQVYFTNVFGFCSMWLTVLTTAECFMHVVYPFHSARWCTDQVARRLYWVIGLTAVTLQLIYPLNRIIVFHCERFVVTTKPEWYPVEAVYAWAELLLVILIPLTLLVVMSIACAYRLLSNSSLLVRRRNTNAKRCVIRITLATTALQLFCEAPATFIYVKVALTGTGAIHEPQMCLVHTVSHFLGLCNTSLSFYLYLALSDRFRSLVGRKFNRWSTRMNPSAATNATNRRQIGKSHQLEMSNVAGDTEQLQLPLNNTSASRSISQCSRVMPSIQETVILRNINILSTENSSHISSL